MNIIDIKHHIVVPLFYTLRALILKWRYSFVLRHLKSIYGKRKIRIGFLVSEISKWKGQTVYELMAQTDDFEPEILIYPSPHDIKYDSERIEEILKGKENYFKNSGMEVRIIWDDKKQKCLQASDINVDIAFFQQTWDIPPAPSFGNMSGRSLTFYYPYYMINGFIADLDVKMYLHYCIFRYILLNEEQVIFYRSNTNSRYYAGKMVGLGHPCVDEFYIKKNYHPTKNYVIYAPHFSFKCDRHTGKNLPYYSSTFLEQGLLVLEFAQKHPEINWVFKPHPRLRTELTDYDVWSKDKVDDYYKSWEKIGTACYDSNYIELFLESKAMITDCSSFLTEYSCTGKPLIRLIPDMGRTLSKPNPALEKLYDSFYKAYNDNELYDLLQMVVLEDKDPMKTIRMENVKNAHLTDNYAARNIVDYIRNLLVK